MKGHGSKFGRKKEEAIVALLTQRNIEEAAKSIGIAPNTLMRWMKEPEFEKSYRQARRAAFGQSIAKLHRCQVRRFRRWARSWSILERHRPTKVRAAEAIITHGAKAIELEDIEARVSELERAAEASKPHSQR
jgi:hypothetical protein